jgi:hypothetical protein
MHFKIDINGLTSLLSNNKYVKNLRLMGQVQQLQKVAGLSKNSHSNLNPKYAKGSRFPVQNPIFIGTSLQYLTRIF